MKKILPIFLLTFIFLGTGYATCYADSTDCVITSDTSVSCSGTIGSGTGDMEFDYCTEANMIGSDCNGWQQTTCSFTVPLVNGVYSNAICTDIPAENYYFGALWNGSYVWSDKYTLPPAPENMVFSLPEGAVANVTTYVTGILFDGWQIIALAIGVPFAFYVTRKVIKITKK